MSISSLHIAPLARRQLGLFCPAESPASPTADWTLTEFVDRWLGPTLRTVDRRRRRKVAAEDTVKRLQETAALWAWATGDPPLGQADEQLIDDFVDLLPRVAWRNKLAIQYEEQIDLQAGWYRHAETTRYNTVVRLGTIFGATGPPQGRLVRAGIFENPPTVGLPDEVDTEPKDPWTLEECRAIASSAELMQWKRHSNTGVNPADWWRCYVGLSYYTGLRLGTVVQLEWRDLVSRFDQPWLHVDGTRATKTGKPKWVRLHSRCAEVIARLRPLGDHDLATRILPPVYLDPQVGKSFSHILVRNAGLAEDRQFTAHHWRATHDWEIQRLGAEQARSAGQAACDHSSAAITTQFYCDTDNMLRPMLPDLWPQGLPPVLF